MCGLADNGLGALTSLSLIGPALDLALWRCSNPRFVYLALTTAGVLTNLAAMLVQFAVKSSGAGGSSGGGKRLAAWLAQAAITYPLCGALAGLLSAAVWFRWNARQRGDREDAIP
jgi:hypothetical protein